MASLDFVFLAEFAKVEASATITAVGAGVRGLGVHPDQPQVGIYLAGCVNRELEEDAVTLTVTTQAPEGLYAISQSVEMEPTLSEGAFATTVFAIQLAIPMAGEGKYVLTVELGDGSPKDIDLWLKFFNSEAVVEEAQPRS